MDGELELGAEWPGGDHVGHLTPVHGLVVEGLGAERVLVDRLVAAAHERVVDLLVVTVPDDRGQRVASPGRADQLDGVVHPDDRRVGVAGDLGRTGGNCNTRSLNVQGVIPQNDLSYS